jgi:hypothetical protein
MSEVNLKNEQQQKQQQQQQQQQQQLEITITSNLPESILLHESDVYHESIGRKDIRELNLCHIVRQEAAMQGARRLNANR